MWNAIRLRQNFRRHVPMDIGEAKIAATVEVSQFGVIDTP
jgi:hypothetical protein